MIVSKDDDRNEGKRMRELLSKIADLKHVDSFYRTRSKTQIGGAFKSTRVYGGQTVVQTYIAAKLYRPDCSPIHMDLTFYGAGSVVKPIDYHAEMNEFEHMRILAKQEGKLLNCTNVRLAKNDKLKESRLKLSIPSFPSNISLDCPTMDEVLKKMNINEWLSTNGMSSRLTSNARNRQIFDMRIPDPFHYVGQDCEEKPLAVWMRLKQEFQSIKFEDDMIIPLLISDYVVGIPSTIAFDQRQVSIKSMASMTHKVIFHSDEFNPLDYFLVTSSVENIQGMALMEGRIFSRNRNPVLTYMQQSYFELNDQKEQAKL